jgi:hypothetical protein
MLQVIMLMLSIFAVSNFIIFLAIGLWTHNEDLIKGIGILMGISIFLGAVVSQLMGLIN